MRKIIVRLYRFAELSEPAQDRAVEIIREKLRGDWWDTDSIDQVEAEIVYALATTLHSPGWDTCDDAEDFPGISRIRIKGWDVGRGGQSLAVSGTLTRDNAPALPWVKGIDHVELTGHSSDATTLYVADAEPDCTCPPAQPYAVPHEQGCPWLAPSPVTDEQRNALKEAVHAALSQAWQAGDSKAEDITGEERARVVAQDHEFTEEGGLPISLNLSTPVPRRVSPA